MKPVEGPWVMVDIELAVSGGVLRRVFHLLGHAPGELPTWRLDVEELRRLGWHVDTHTIEPPPGNAADDESFPNHPYALGPAWRGANRWEAHFPFDAGRDVVAVVTHELLIGENEQVEAGLPLSSASPWVWWIDALPGGRRAGRAESPVLAAAAVETLLGGEGASIVEPTCTRRSVDGTPIP
ncbi:MAG: hypothetical protein ACRDZ2_09820 [Ilumatobacteraceae bacterium]